MFVLLMEPNAMIQVSTLLQPRRTAAGAISFQEISVCFGGTPGSHSRNMKIPRNTVEKHCPNVIKFHKGKFRPV